MIQSIIICGIEFKPSPNRWDRTYGVDFYVEVNGRFIGVQIKPATYHAAVPGGRFKGTLRTQHRKFTREFGGKVFLITKEAREEISEEICNEIKKELERLKGLPPTSKSP